VPPAEKTQTQTQTRKPQTEAHFCLEELTSEFFGGFLPENSGVFFFRNSL
jgi:hypothetical protein